MKFYYVYENSMKVEVTGSLYQIYNKTIKKLAKEDHHSGFIGAIDSKGKLRATLFMHSYRGKFKNALFDFIRKYRAIEVLELLSQELQRKLK